MLVQRVLRGLPIIGRNCNDAIGADFFGMTRKVYRLVGPRRADVHDDRHSSCGHLDRRLGKSLRSSSVRLSDSARCRLTHSDDAL